MQAIGKTSKTIMRDLSKKLGKEYFAESEERFRKEEKEKDYEKRRTNLASSGIIGSITDDDVDLLITSKLRKTKSVDAVTRWLRAASSYLALFGTTGCGKTLACAHALAEHGGKYLTVKKLERIFLAQYGEALKMQDMYAEFSGILVVDDVGTELDTEKFASSFFEVIHARQGHGRRTIFTANMPKQEFIKNYSDPRLLSRLRRCLFIGDKGKDLRKEK